MVAKRPGWTYLNLEILTGQLRCLKMAQSVKSSPGGVNPPPTPVSLGLRSLNEPNSLNIVYGAIEYVEFRFQP